MRKDQGKKINNIEAKLADYNDNNSYVSKSKQSYKPTVKDTKKQTPKVKNPARKKNLFLYREEVRRLILDYISNVDNPKITRGELATQVLCFKRQQDLYKLYSAAELNKIEWEALEIRRRQYAPYISMVDKGILEKAATGDAAAAKLVYQRFEGWSEKTISEYKIGFPALEKILSALPEIYAEKVKQALIEKKQPLKIVCSQEKEKEG